jgi:membrane protease YdiL (CAAX protease family)
LFVAILLIVVLWEKQPLASLWLRPFQWQSLAWAGVLVLASVLILYPATEWARKALGLPGYGAGMEKALALPVWFRVVAVVTAGIVEETLFRGYAVTRLARLTGSLWLAAVLSASVFAALHFPVWGAGPVFHFLIGGVAATAFFIWRRDLLAMIIAHVAIDAWGLVITPLYSEWWR